MSSEDFLMRQFRQLAQVIARMIGLQENKRFNEALNEIDQAFDTWFKITPEAFEKNEKEWDTLFADPSNHYESEKIIAELLYQRTMIFLKMELFSKAKQTARASLFFFKKIDVLSGEFSIEIQERITHLEEIYTSENH